MLAIRHFYIYSALCARIFKKLRNNNGIGKDKDKDNFLCSNKHAQFLAIIHVVLPRMSDLTPNFDDAPMWSLNMSNTNVIGLNSFTNVTALAPNQLPMWPPWTSFTKVTKIDFSFLPICPTWLLPMCPRWDCLKIFTNMSAPPNLPSWGRERVIPYSEVRGQT